MSQASDIANPPVERKQFAERKEFAWPHGRAKSARVERAARPRARAAGNGDRWHSRVAHARVTALRASPIVYRSLIREDAERLGRPDVDLRHVEAYMRLERGTLEHLSRTEFLNEVIVAIRCLDTAGPQAATQLANSLGLPF